MASIRLPASTSFTSVTDRSWPIASGVSVSGNGTLSRSGRIGSVSGRLVRTAASVGSPFADGMWMLILRWARAAPSPRAAQAESPPREPRPRRTRGRRQERPRRPARPGGGTALSRNQELATADLEGHVLDVDAREIGLHHRPRRVVRVVDVHGGREAAAAEPRLALEHVAEQLV